MTQEVDRYLAEHELPDDLDVLTRALEHRDGAVQLQVMTRIQQVLAEGEPKRTRALLGQLKMIRDLGDDPELTQMAEGLIEKL